MKEINHLVEQLFKNYPEFHGEGRLIKLEEFNTLPRIVRNHVPDWYKELLSTFPLAGLEIGIPNGFGQDELIGKPIEKLPLMEVKINDISEIKEFSTEIFPGYQLIKDRYICFARDDFSTGEGIYFDGKEVNPAINLIFHDIGETNKELLKNAIVLTNCFTDLFRYGKVSNSKRQLPVDKKDSASHAVKRAVDAISEFLLNNIDSSNEENLRKAKELIAKSDNFIKSDNPIKAIEAITDSIHDFEVKVPTAYYDLAVDAFNKCGLHVGELCYMENITIRK